MSAQDEIDKLRREVEELQLSKLELIRSTSAEIEKMRQTIRFLTGKTDLKAVNEIGYSPLSASDRQYISNRVSTQHPRIDLENIIQKVVNEQQKEMLEREKELATQSRRSNENLLTDDKNNNNSNNKNNKNNKNRKSQNNMDDYVTDQYQTPTGLNDDEDDEYSTKGNDKNNERNENENDSNNRGHSDENDESSYSGVSTGIRGAGPAVNQDNSGLSTIDEDESQSDASNGNKRKPKQNSVKLAPPPANGSKNSGDEHFRISSKRMSRQGFVFSELGFMTTDFEQLERGHTQWVNHVIHHPFQNGICVSASNDSCIFFWRMREYSSEKEELSQEKYDSKIARYKYDHLQQKAMIDACKSNQPNLQAIHTVGEIKLHPLLKINTGVQIKGISMSKEGNILACVCYDDEEEETDPELELYYDDEQLWCFQQDHMDYGNSTNSMKGGRTKDRIIKRKVIPLPFPPIDRGIQFTKDSKFLFVALESTHDRPDDNDSDNDSDTSDKKDDWPEEACTLICIDVTTKQVRPCERINNLMASNEYVRCFSLSRDGQRIGIGTNLGRLIVTGVKHLTGAYDENSNSQPDGNDNAQLWRIWIGDDFKKNDNSGIGVDNDGYHNSGNSHNNNNDNNVRLGAMDGHVDGGLSAIEWSGDSEWLISGYESGSIKLWKKNKEPRLSINVNKALNIMMKRAHVPRKSKLFTCKWMLEGLHVESINSFSINASLLISGSDDGTIIIHDLYQTFIDSDSAPILQNKNNGNNTNVGNYNNNNNNMISSMNDDRNSDSDSDNDNKRVVIDDRNEMNNNNNNNSGNGNENEKESDDLSNNSPSTLGKIDRLHGGRMVTSVQLTPNYSEETLLVPTAGLYMVSSGADNVIHCLSLLGVLRNSIRTKFYNQRL